MDREYGDRYRDLFERHWWWRARTEYIIEKLRRYCPAGGFKTILDVGCGDGLFFDRLQEFGEVEGVEPDAQLVNPANPHRNRIYIQPFDENFAPQKSYSLILMLDVLEHIEHPAAALKHALDLLAPEGLFVATVPAFRLLWTNHDVMNHHFTRYTKRTFREVASQAGLNVAEERYLYHWTFPAKVGVRLMEGILRLKPKPPVASNGWTNHALFRLSRLEQKLLTPLPVPFGSSLLVIGKTSRPRSK